MTRKLAITKREAKRICLEMWDWCKETGQNKMDWPEWGRYSRKYPGILYCPYCLYAGKCSNCPIVKHLGFHCQSVQSHYHSWEIAMFNSCKGEGNIKKIKAEADLFYQQLLKT